MTKTEPARDFVLRVDKPVGPTSHDVVAQARRALGTRRIGHTGTLDPFASGLLLLCVNRATRIAEYLAGLDKSYVAIARLDAFTETDDHTGAVIEAFESWRTLPQPAVEAALAELARRTEQVPSVYSAKKLGGERAYRRARVGAAVQLAPVSIRVHAVRLLRYDPPEVEFEIDCTSGTYVRALARDLGQLLGTGGHLSALRRTGIGHFAIAGAVTLDTLANPVARATATHDLADALRHLPGIAITGEEASQLAHGQPIHVRSGSASGPVILALEEGSVFAVVRRDGDWLRPHKVLALPE